MWERAWSTASPEAAAAGLCIRHQQPCASPAAAQVHCLRADLCDACAICRGKGGLPHHHPCMSQQAVCQEDQPGWYLGTKEAVSCWALRLEKALRAWNR